MVRQRHRPSRSRAFQKQYGELPLRGHLRTCPQCKGEGGAVSGYYEPEYSECHVCNDRLKVTAKLARRWRWQQRREEYYGALYWCAHYGGGRLGLISSYRLNNANSRRAGYFGAVTLREFQNNYIEA